MFSNVNVIKNFGAIKIKKNLPQPNQNYPIYSCDISAKFETKLKSQFSFKRMASRVSPWTSFSTT